MSLTEAAEDVLREKDPAALMEALGLHLNETPTLRPGTDYRDGHLYMTVPVDRDETITIGRGKAAKEITRRITTTIAVRDDGDFFLYDEQTVAELDFRFPQTFTQSLNSRWELADVKKFLSGDRAKVDAAALYNDLRQVFLTYVEYPDDIYYHIVPLFVMGSYVYRLFKATGYIHFNGTQASGKSQNLRLMAATGLNTVWASNMTSAALFRQVAGNPGIICVDEAESFESERGQELRQILLSGYNEGSAASRTEKGANDRFVVVHYETYAPKVLASINPLEPVLASRCLIVPMAPAIRKIPDFDPVRAGCPDIRNRLYRWAMQEAGAIATIRDAWTMERREAEAGTIQHRGWEIAQFYLTLAEHLVGPELVTTLIGFFSEYFEQANKARVEADNQYKLLKALPRVMSEKQAYAGLYYSLKDIHAIVSGYLEEDAREYYKTRTVSRHLTTLGFKDRKMARGGSQVHLDEAEIRAAFQKRHVTPFDEDIEWFEGQRNYQDNLTFDEPNPPPPESNLSWLDNYNETET